MGIWSCAFDDLVEFASVEPDAATVGAVVDLDAGSVGHDESSGGTGRAFHEFISEWLGQTRMVRTMRTQLSHAV